VLQVHPHSRERKKYCSTKKSHLTGGVYRLARPKKESSANSLETVVADRFTIIRITGLCCAKYAQKTQSAFDKHKYPSGKCVVKAFIPSGWKFYNSKDCVINVQGEEDQGAHGNGGRG